MGRRPLGLAAVAAAVNHALIARGRDAVGPATISPAPSAPFNTSAPAEISGTVNWAVCSDDALPEFRALRHGFEKKFPSAKLDAFDSPASDYSAEPGVRLAAGDDTDVLTIKTKADRTTLMSKQRLIDIADAVKVSDAGKLINAKTYSINATYAAVTYRADFRVLVHTFTSGARWSPGGTTAANATLHRSPAVRGHRRDRRGRTGRLRTVDGKLPENLAIAAQR